MKKSMKRAVREDRAAILPPWLAEGRTVWYWRETICDEDGCLDVVSPICPFNVHSPAWNDPEVRSCAMEHPVLDKMEVYDVRAVFTRRGISWEVNEGYGVADSVLRQVYFPTREAALAHRPRRIEYG